VCEEVAIELVKGACTTLNTDYAIAATGFAGPGGGTKEIPVGTIWLACGSKDRVVTKKVEEDHGRDINLAIATNAAIQLFRDFLKEEDAEDAVATEQ
jgi:nicotinamide-nucleotide amidase